MRLIARVGDGAFPLNPGRTIAVPVNAPADKIGDRLHVSDLPDNINPAINGGIGLRNSYGESRLAHYDEAGNVLVGEPEEAAGRALVSEGEEVSGDTRGEHGQPVAPWRRVARHCDVTDQQTDSRISLAAT